MNPKFRQILYTFGVVVFAALAVLSTFKVIDPNTAGVISAAVTAILGLFGVTVSGVAAYNVTKQTKDGTFDPTPDVTPDDKVANGIQEALAAKQAADEAVERIKNAVSNGLSEVPVLGPLAQQAINSLPKL